MRLRRKPRVFLSYSHENRDLFLHVKERLIGAGILVIFDEGLQAGDHLDIVVQKKIAQSDGLLTIGTKEFMQSRWCEQEVRFALYEGKEYYPVVFGDPEDIPEWFKRRGPIEIIYSKVPAVDADEVNLRYLDLVIEKILQKPPISLFFSVFLILICVFVLPPLAALIYVNRIDLPPKDVRVLQEWVEDTNHSVTESRSGGGPYELVYHWTSKEISYHDRTNGEVIAKDEFLDILGCQRTFFRAGKEVAVDSIVQLQAPNGATSLLKKRIIYPNGPSGFVIEEDYNSVGQLVSKRSRRSHDDGWQWYREVSSSIFPILFFYR